MIENVVLAADRLTLVVAGAELALRFGRPRQVAVGWNGALGEPSYGVADPGEACCPRVEHRRDGILVHGDGISVGVGHDGRLRYFDGQRRLRRDDDPPQLAGPGWSLRTLRDAAAGVHGLPGRAAWEYTGGRYRCWNTDPGGAWLPGRDPLYVTTPMYTVLDGVGAVHCFIDNTCDGTIDVAEDAVVARFDDGPARWHVTVGTLAQIADSGTALTGRPAAGPRWGFGYHQARWGYGSAAEVRDVWQGFRSHDLPISAVHLDIDYMVKFQNFTFNDKFKDVDGLIAEMAEDGVATVVIVDAGTARSQEYGVFREGAARGAFCRSASGGVYEGVVWPGPTVFPDFTSADARAWWGEQFAAFTDRGVAGYWHDMNEPVCFGDADEGETTFPLDTVHDLDGRGGDHRSAHNIYGQQMCRASYEGLRRLQPQRRPFIFSRSGWAGQQRYGGHWSGDIEAGYASLLGTIHQALSFGLGGVGYYGSDIGGFTGAPSPELFTRWFQLGSFMPFFRTHCSFDVPRREPWCWGPEVMGRLRTALKRRYRLMPYWYTLALSAARDGAPFIRPLAWLDPDLRGVGDEFLVGEDILVAPVIEEGADRRRVVLPTGAWFHGDTGERYEGEPLLSVGPDDIPWFVRAGSAVPTEEDGRLVLLAAPPVGTAPGGRLLTDAGDGWAQPREERYSVGEERGEVVVGRTVVADGAFPYSGVGVGVVGGRPGRLVGDWVGLDRRTDRR